MAKMPSKGAKTSTGGGASVAHGSASVPAGRKAGAGSPPPMRKFSGSPKSMPRTMRRMG